jgi:hypothetical protein
MHAQAKQATQAKLSEAEEARRAKLAAIRARQAQLSSTASTEDETDRSSANSSAVPSKAPTPVTPHSAPLPEKASIRDANTAVLVEGWTVADVRDWLTSKNLGGPSKKFEEAGIDGKAILKLRLKDVQNLGIPVRHATAGLLTFKANEIAPVFSQIKLLQMNLVKVLVLKCILTADCAEGWLVVVIPRGCAKFSVK